MYACSILVSSKGTISPLDRRGRNRRREAASNTCKTGRRFRISPTKTCPQSATNVIPVFSQRGTKRINNHPSVQHLPTEHFHQNRYHNPKQQTACHSGFWPTRHEEDKRPESRRIKQQFVFSIAIVGK